ncbi:uncharacterized protein GLRG_05060 [Colletotrichum graminicola M1.001]|uniref:Uncharacterized protein n=1 Tax=Colletotrichum graminicola (strain M1.001 / M2 / FGSC 10212) TaxID=645133 RepID=E3QGC8_COLGM|nr:uncharacterized protein GLRG_05060 [Colletotrichum graminicola M1.001]EFQ29916.1 hypothetical protein GLRG_05060 [Colletotrichum graminicola M1.001]
MEGADDVEIKQPSVAPTEPHQQTPPAVETSTPTDPLLSLLLLLLRPLRLFCGMAYAHLL